MKRVVSVANKPKKVRTEVSLHTSFIIALLELCKNKCEKNTVLFATMSIINPC
jgi:hypothetical protein